MIQIVYTVPKVAENAKTYSFRRAVPIRRGCPVVAPPFSLPGNEWNCNLCGADEPYFIPYLSGDIFPLQTNFADTFNTDPSVLNYGFLDMSSADHYIEVELQDSSGVAVTSFIDAFCETYYVAYSEKYGSVQTWFVNTALLPETLKCWRLKITYYTFNQVTLTKEVERVLYTEYYKELEGCYKTVDLYSTYNGMDCYGNIYDEFTNTLGTTPQTYYNFLRLEGEVELLGTDDVVDVQTDYNRAIRKTVTENYRVLAGIVAPYFARMLYRLIQGAIITVEGIEYTNFSFDRNNEASRMWVIELTFQKNCTLDNRGCNL